MKGFEREFAAICARYGGFPRYFHIEEILSRTGIDATTGYDSTKELKYYPGHQNHLHVKYNN